MIAILLRRSLLTVAQIWLIVSLAFFALRLLPGDAIQIQLLGTGVSPAELENRRAQLGFNLPLLDQYRDYLIALLRGDLGYSLLDGQPVIEMIAQRYPPTLSLAISAVSIASMLGIGLGVMAGLESGTFRSEAARIVLRLSQGTPIYWTGTLAIIIFADIFRVFPPSGLGTLGHLIMPACILGFHIAGGIGRIVEGAIAAERQVDHVRTAQAKGLTRRAITIHHILRPILAPVVVMIALQANFVLGGTVIIETLFLRSGLGKLLIDATLQQDYPVVQGLVILGATTTILLNEAAHSLHDWLDPRVRVPS